MRTGETPPFWWRRDGWQSLALEPAARLYGAVARRNLKNGPRAETGVPTLCVGNFTLGGGGKTPTVLALAETARAAGFHPGIVSRGYGRHAKEALLVDASRHSAEEVGDEPLMLATVAPTAVAADRARAARLLTGERGCDFLLMDDGFQSARLAMDYALLVVDGRRGLGNGRVIPAGPLRAPLEDQIVHADAFLVTGEGIGLETAARLGARSNRPVFRSELLPKEPERFAGLRCLAFAGIADPEKFFLSLAAAGAIVEETRSFPDHHAYRKAEMTALSGAAWAKGLQLVTTRKDASRLANGAEATRLFLAECEVLDMVLRFEPDGAAARIVRDTAEAFRRRRFGAL